MIGNRLILNGIDNARGWTAVIDVETGGMTIMVSDHNGGFMVFGVCMEIDDSDAQGLDEPPL